MRTDPSGGSQLLPVVGISYSGTSQGSALLSQGLTGVPASASDLLDGLSALTAIGVSLPPPSLMHQLMGGNLPAADPQAHQSPPTPPGLPGTPPDAISGSPTESPTVDEADAAEGSAGGPEADLTDEEQRQVEDLQQRDREVRQHEQAHMAAAGGHARGGPSYEYTTGPDGKRYAAGGEVSIDTSKVSGDPEATIRKAQLVYRAALAPAEPSSQDRSVASQAKQMEMEARQELTEQRMEEGRQGDDATGEMDGDGPNAPGPSSPSSTDQGGDVGSLLDLLG